MRSEDVDLGVECHESHRPVTWIDGDALIADSEYGMRPIESADSRTACPWLALVASEGFAATEVGTAGPLKQIAAKRGHVPQLLRCRFLERLGEGGVVAKEPRVGGDVAHACE